MVIHIMKDGTVKTDITGHVVKMDDAKAVYNVLDRINRRSNEKNKRGRDSLRRII